MTVFFYILGWIVITAITVILAFWLSNRTTSHMDKISSMAVAKRIMIILFATAVTGLLLLIVIQNKNEINKVIFNLLDNLKINREYKEYLTVLPILVLVLYTCKINKRK